MLRLKDDFGMFELLFTLSHGDLNESAPPGIASELLWAPLLDGYGILP